MVLFCVSFHLQQDRFTCQKRGDEKGSLLSLQWDKRGAFFSSLQEMKDLLHKNSNNNEKRAISLDCSLQSVFTLCSRPMWHFTLSLHTFGCAQITPSPVEVLLRTAMPG